MTKSPVRSAFLFLSMTACAMVLSACGSDKWFGEPEKPPLAGERKSALTYDRTLRPETDGSFTSFSAPDSIANTAWTQAGGNPSHVMGNLTLSNGALKKIWTADIGQGSRDRLPLTAQPVVAGQSIFTLDTDATLSSFDISNGKKRWSVDVRDELEEDPVISGGLAIDNGFVFVTAGYDEVLSVNATDGAIKWRSKIISPSRAAPTVMDGRVYVTTLNNSLVALNADNGSVIWEFSGIDSQTGLIGAASPAIVSDLVIPAFSSGEVYALRTANGSVAWSDNLSGALRLGGLNTLSDIRGLPVVDDNIVYAISFAGKMAAIDLLTGSRVWQKDISGSKTPWVSGNRVFVISTEGQIISLDKDKGTVIWVSQLARFKNKTERTGPIFWAGPIMGGGRLLAFSSDGRIAEIDPEKGTLIRESKNGQDVRISPVIAGETLYILSESGNLIAYR